MFKVAIVDDDETWRNELGGYIDKFAAEHKTQINYKTFPDGLDVLMDYRPVYDVIFLDINMPHSNGIEVAKKIREQDEVVTIIFIADDARCAIQGYDVNALDFAVKPLDYLNFSFKMQRALSVVQKHKKTEVAFKVAGEIKKISVNSILYLESKGHCIVIHCDNQTQEIWHQTFKKTEARLKKFGFARCHNGFLVNLQHVKGVKGDGVLVGDEVLPVSRAKKDVFLAALSEYLM